MVIFIWPQFRSCLGILWGIRYGCIHGIFRIEIIIIFIIFDNFSTLNFIPLRVKFCKI